MIQATCPGCGKAYYVADKMAGRTAKCRECGGLIPVTAPAEGTSQAAAVTATVTADPEPVETRQPAAAPRTPTAQSDRRPDASSERRASAKSGQAQRRSPASSEAASADKSRSKASRRPGPAKSGQPASASRTRRPPDRQASRGHSEDDLFLDDDYEAAQDYDDGYDDYEDYGAASDGYDEYDDYGQSDYGRPSRSRPRQPKKKKKKSGAGRSFNLSFLFSDLTESAFMPFVVWLGLSVGISLTVQWLGLFSSARVTFLMTSAIVGTILSGLWLTVTNFRVNPAMAAVIIGAAGLNKTMARSGLAPVAALLSLGVIVIQIYLIATNWDRYWKVTLCYALSLASLALMIYLTTFHDLRWGNAM